MMRKRKAPPKQNRAARPGRKPNPLADWKKRLLRSCFPYRPPRRSLGQLNPYEAILRDYADYEREMNAEIVAAGSGLKGELDTATITAKHAGLFAPRNIRSTRSWADRLPGKALVDRHERTAWAMLEGLIARKTAKSADAADNIAGSGRVSLNGGGITYFETLIALSRETDPAERQLLWEARTAFVEKTLNPALIGSNRNLIKVLRRLGFSSQRQFSEEKRRLNFDDLAEHLWPLAAATEPAYVAAMRRFARHRLGSAFPGMSRAHEAYFLSLREFDRFFPADRLLVVGDRTFRGLGLDLSETPNLRLDTVDRPRKEPRAFCVSTNAPESVDLILKPRGGVEDYASLLHEAGHAWHYALTDPGLPYELRAMCRSYALTETYAFLLELLLQNTEWLVAVAGLDPPVAAALARRQKLTDLYLLRRFIGKLIYELEFQRHPADNLRNRFCYEKIMLGMTGVRHDGAYFLEDMDEDLYVADYLRAWIAEAQLREHLTAALGNRWFDDPAAGDLLRSFWAKGDGWECEDLISSLGLQPWDTSALQRRFLDL